MRMTCGGLPRRGKFLSDTPATPATRFLSLTHFRSARHFRRIASIASSVCLAAAALAAATAILLRLAGSVATETALLGLGSGSLLLAATGLLSTAAICRARLLVLVVEEGSVDA